MKTKLTILLSVLILTNYCLSQNNGWCGVKYQQDEEILKQDSLTRLRDAAKPECFPKSGIYKIPVVFHVLYYNLSDKITEEQILSGLEVLNQDFNKLNPDTADVIPLFQPIIGNPKIEFVLATKAPNGTCFRGYTYTISLLTNDGSDYSAQSEAVKNGNDVYQGNWPSNKYLNIYLVKHAGGDLVYGHAELPSGSNDDMVNGVWLLNNMLGTVGTSNGNGSRILTHEVGHWLNLYHTWGQTNGAGYPYNCNDDDDVLDTPNCVGVNGCYLTQDNCGSTANVQNYMDYSYCLKMFTVGQSDRMQAALQSSVGNRNNLWTAQNLAETGTDGNLEMCETDFFSDQQVVCAGTSVQFTDHTYNIATEWTWTFPGGTPSSSTEENPLIFYNTPGIYPVTLQAGDGLSISTEMKSDYILVLQGSSSLPFHEGFENYTSLNNNENWYISNPGNNAKWELTETAAHFGNKSVKLANFGQIGQNLDELQGSILNLSNSTLGNTVFSFRYAYRKIAPNNQEYLRLYFRGDCDEDWESVKTISSSLLSNGFPYETQDWTPGSQSDWKTYHFSLDNPNLQPFFEENFRYKFQFTGNGGNNIFLDDINIYEGVASDTLVNSLGVESTELVNNLTLYPNPVQEDLSIDFNLIADQNLEISIVDLAGKELNSIVIHAKSGQNLVMMGTDKLSSGIYLVSIKGSGTQQTLRFIKE